MKISVVVTNWNGLKLLKKNLETIIKNSPEADEIILADDASEDKSIAYAKKLKSIYPKLKIITHNKNIGFGANSNDAVNKSSGELVVLLNNDILPHPNYISNLLFTCYPTPEGKNYIEIEFTLRTGDGEASNSARSTTLDFSSGLVTRN